jgi:hypothetical protein
MMPKTAIALCAHSTPLLDNATAGDSAFDVHECVATRSRQKEGYMGEKVEAVIANTTDKERAAQLLRATRALLLGTAAVAAISHALPEAIACSTCVPGGWCSYQWSTGGACSPWSGGCTGSGACS